MNFHLDKGTNSKKEYTKYENKHWSEKKEKTATSKFEENSLHFKVESGTTT